MAIDPDKLLGRLLDTIARELRQVRANARQGAAIETENGTSVVVKTCPMCKRDMGMSEGERKWLIEAGKLTMAVAFGARKMIAEKLLKALSEGGLEAFANGMAERERNGQWLPDV